jgi:hypothetical protein
MPRNLVDRTSLPSQPALSSAERIACSEMGFRARLPASNSSIAFSETPEASLSLRLEHTGHGAAVDRLCG